MKQKSIVILGAGGHGRVVADAARSTGRTVAAFLDSTRALWRTEIDGIPVRGGNEALSEFPTARFAVAIGVGGKRDTKVRRALHELVATGGWELPALIAASAVVSPYATVGAGTQIITRAVIHNAAAVGDGVVVNTAAIVEHDCVVGSHTFIGPGAILCGGAHIGPRAFIGAGAVILPGVRVGADALVAAGAIIRAHVADGAKALGRSPVRKIR